MNYLGIKIIGLDSASCLIDFARQSIHAVSTDRITRIKKDNLDSRESLAWALSQSDGSDIFVSACFSHFDSQTQLLENAASSFQYSLIERAVRRIYKPSYRKDLVPFNSFRHKAISILAIALNPLLICTISTRNKLYKSFRNGDLPASLSLTNIAKLLHRILPHQHDSSIKGFQFVDHHTSHAFCAHYLAPFSSDSSYIFTIDELGDGIFLSLSRFINGKFDGFITRELAPPVYTSPSSKPHYASVPSIYSNFTEALGFIRSSDEGKVEALAAYGKPDKALLEKLSSCFIVEQGDQIDASMSILSSNTLVLSDFYSSAYLATLVDSLGPETVAATVQAWLEAFSQQYLSECFRRLQIQSSRINLGLAGGASANVIMNLGLYELLKPRQLFVAPPMGDDGASMGAALFTAASHGKDLSWISKKYPMPYWGPKITSESALQALKSSKYSSELIFSRPLTTEDLVSIIVQDLALEKVVAIATEKSEFGPRALGNRSIIALPTSPKTRDLINTKIKRRPYFQPFCPSVLEEDREELFVSSYSHKHMAIAFRLRPEFAKKYPSACHIDLTARPQFVTESDNPFYYRLLKQIKSLIGHGILINTSFNLHGRPTVCDASHAIDDFIACQIHSMVLGDFYVTKKSR